MDRLSLEKATVLGGLVYFINVRRKYVSLVGPVERILDSQRSAYHSMEGCLSLLIRADENVKPEYLMKMLVQQYNRIPPADQVMRSSYVDLLKQLDDRNIFTEDICMRLLEETIKAKAIRALQEGITQPGSIRAVEQAITSFNAAVTAIRQRPEDEIRIWNPLEDMEELLIEKPRTPTGVAIIDKLLAGGIAVGEHTGILGPSGGGKCHGRGTPILMYDGSVKKVEDVVIGDVLMGPDSTPRRVLELGRGRDNMYRIVPVKGDSYTVNSAHILTLTALAGVVINGKSYAKGDWVDINVEDYTKLSRYKKAVLKGVRTAVDFPEIDAPELDPYFAGVYIGDGNTRWYTALTNADEEILQFCISYGVGRGWSVTRCMDRHCPRLNLSGIDQITGKRVRELIFSSCVKQEQDKHVKYIASCYKYGSRKVRLALLAGLIDTDGYMHHGHYEISTKFDALAEDILFIARSLGYAAYDNYCEKTCTNTGASAMYHRITISGDFSDLPVRLERRKRGPRKQCKDVLHTGITVEPIGIDDYFGFVIDGDHHYVLGDFTVTHNTICANALQCNLAIRKYNTLLIQTEQTISGDITNWMYAYMLGLPISTFLGKSLKDIDPLVIQRIRELKPVWDCVRCVSTADKTAKTSHASNEVVEIIEKVMDTGFVPQFVIIDWLGKLVLDFMRGSENDNAGFYLKAEDLKATLNTFFRAHNISAFYLHQTDTEAQNREPGFKPGKNNADKYRAFANDLESCLVLGTATKFDDGLQVAWMGAPKARMMQSGKYAMVKIDGSRATITECEDGEYALNAKGQFQPVRDLIGVSDSGKAHLKGRESVYAPPEGSSDAFMLENY